MSSRKQELDNLIESYRQILKEKSPDSVQLISIGTLFESISPVSDEYARQELFNDFAAVDATSYYLHILKYYSNVIKNKFPNTYLNYITNDQIIEMLKPYGYEYYQLYAFYHLGKPYIIPCIRDNATYLTSKILNGIKKQKEWIAFYNNPRRYSGSSSKSEIENCQLQINRLEELNIAPLVSWLDSLFDKFETEQKEIITLYNTIKEDYIKNRETLSSYLSFLLNFSWYQYDFTKEFNMQYDINSKTLVIDYKLPSKDEVPNRNFKSTRKYGYDLMPISDTAFRKSYENILYAIILRTISEIFLYDTKNYIDNICFNGITKNRNIATGQREEKCIASILVRRENIESIDYNYVDPKAWFKACKGVATSKIYESVEIKPIITINKNDTRIVANRNITTSIDQNLAEMDWEDFEHLVRQVFEWEFSDHGGEVNVTQSSRDGGVDAIVFDPDPIRGGKIVIQAKRYTNTVPVSAIRDLYGTIINEGANKGILITTSDYGPDSYKFAKGKPITLLNGGHLLYLLRKHGHSARIDIKEAKDNFKKNI